METNIHRHEQSHHKDHSDLHESKTRWVVLLTIVTMLLEISVGLYSNSMALIAEGWHMSTHVFAIGLTWLAYFLARKYAQHEKISFKKEKVFSLGGFTSAIVLLVIAVIMVIESVQRLAHPVNIKYSEAIYVAVIGLIVNGISARLLHHNHHEGDHNIRAAYFHVLADVLTSLTAIIALTLGLYFKIYSLDAISGIIGAIVITSWSVQLIRDTGIELIEFKRKK